MRETSKITSIIKENNHEFRAEFKRKLVKDFQKGDNIEGANIKITQTVLETVHKITTEGKKWTNKN